MGLIDLLLLSVNIIAGRGHFIIFFYPVIRHKRMYVEHPNSHFMCRHPAPTVQLTAIDE